MERRSDSGVDYRYQLLSIINEAFAANWSSAQQLGNFLKFRKLNNL